MIIWWFDIFLPAASLRAPLLQGLRQRRPAKIRYCISRGHFFKRMHWKFERNLSCWMFRQKDNSGTWMSLICDFVCPCVCFVCLLVCLLFMFLFDWVLDWWSAVCRQTNVVQLSTFNKKREQFTEQARRRQQCCTMYSYQHRSREAVNSKQAKRQTTMAVDVN